MTTPTRLAASCVVFAALLAYLHDPAWLARTESGFRPWETAADGTRVRWTGGHASFFVPSDASAITVPIRTTFASPAEGPVNVTLTVDDRVSQRLVLVDDQWHQVRIGLPAPGRRRLRRIDIRVDRTRPGNRGVQVGSTELR